MGDSSGQAKFNTKNSTVKRILQEFKDMQADPSPDFIALPLEDDILDWQFAISGPRDTDYEGGIYHGRIQLPQEYPLKPPSFMMLTPNGRFETQTPICLSISNYHPEHWQPSWGIRTALVALIAFMPTKPEGAVGSVDYKKEEKRSLAVKSREAPPKYGTADRQKIIEEIHQYMISKASLVPQFPTAPTANENTDTANAQAQSGPGDSNSVAIERVNELEAEEMLVEDRHELQLNAEAGPLRVRFTAGVTLTRSQAVEANQQNQRAIAGARPLDDRLFTCAAIGLTVAIIVLLVKKFLKSNGIAIFTE